MREGDTQMKSTSLYLYGYVFPNLRKLKNVYTRNIPIEQFSVDHTHGKRTQRLYWVKLHIV